MVGQRFIQLLSNHPWFEIAWLAASDRSAGKTYGEACRWKLDTPLPARIAAMTMQPNVPEGCVGELPKIIFAALDADIARELEPEVCRCGLRGDLELECVSHGGGCAAGGARGECGPSRVDWQAEFTWRKQFGGNGGYIVTNPNCSAIGLVLALKPLEERFGIESLFVSTMQAVSGAGYPGVASLDILGNVVPFIKNEEEKLQEEVGKLLGSVSGNGIEMLDAKVSAHCNRVAVEDGHTECVSVKLRKKATHEEIVAAWNEFPRCGTLCRGSICRDGS